MYSKQVDLKAFIEVSHIKITTAIKLTVAKSHIFRVLSSEAETSSFESDDQDTSEIP